MIDQIMNRTYVSELQKIVVEACESASEPKIGAAERAYERIKAKVFAGDFEVEAVWNMDPNNPGEPDSFCLCVDIGVEGEPDAWDLTQWLSTLARRDGLRIATTNYNRMGMSSARLTRRVDNVYLFALAGDE